MTDHRFPPNPVPPGGPPPAADKRPLPPGGGNRLRALYLRFLVMAVVAVLIVLSFVLSATVSAIGDDYEATLLVGSVVITISSVCLIAAVMRGRAAVDGDLVSIPTAVNSRRLARVGSLVGWIGALAVVATGVIRHYQQVDMALLEGIVLGGAALIPAVGNDSVNRTARRITG